MMLLVPISTILLAFWLSLVFFAIDLLEGKHASFVVNFVVLTPELLLLASIISITNNIDVFMSSDRLLLLFLEFKLRGLQHFILILFSCLLLLFRLLGLVGEEC